jgi:hypothetical protein
MEIQAKWMYPLTPTVAEMTQHVSLCHAVLWGVKGERVLE